jgi:hypothetical protein
MWPLGWKSFINIHVVITCTCKVVFHSSFFLHFLVRSLTSFASKWSKWMTLQVSKVAWTEVCLGVSQTTHDLYGLTVVSIEISKFLHCTILVTISAKSFFQQNFNLKWTKIQRGMDLGYCWMLFFIVEKDLLARPWRMLRLPMGDNLFWMANTTIQ